MKKGSLTLPFALAFPLVLVLLLTLVESARAAGLKRAALAAGHAAVNSVFGAYNRTLFDEYGLLFFDGSYGGGYLNFDAMEAEYLENYRAGASTLGLFPGGSFYYSDIAKVRLSEVVCATDYNAEPFIRSVLSFFKYDFAGEMVDQVNQLIQSEKDGQGALEETENGAAGAADFISDLGEYGLFAGRDPLEEQTTRSVSTPRPEKTASAGLSAMPMRFEEPDEEYDSLSKEERDRIREDVDGSVIGKARKLRRKNIFDQLLPGEMTISAKKLEQEDLPSVLFRDNRWTYSGNLLQNAITRVTFSEYLIRHFSNYATKTDGVGLDYELEYIILGEKADRRNLERILTRILLIREGVNTLHILTSNKQEAAKVAAETLAGWTGVTAIVIAVEALIIAAWAFAESLIDTRALLQRKKIALFKTDETWVLSFENLGEALIGGNFAAKEVEFGIGYEDYLRMFLYVANPNDAAYRAMDLIQVRMQASVPNFLMASQVYAAEYTVFFVSEPLLFRLPLADLLPTHLLPYAWTRKFSESY